jgi:lipase
MRHLDFAQIYAAVPTEQRQRLQAFRAGHPQKVLQVDGKAWSYLACGQGQKTLLFLAGAFLPADMWFYPIGELEKDFRILAPDTNMLIGLSARQALDALPRLLDAEGVQKASLIGLSAGGGIAQLLLQEHPERVEDVALSHTGVIEYRPEIETYSRRLIGLVKILPLFIVRRMLLQRTSGVVPASSQWRQFHDAYFRESSARITRQAVLSFLENGIALRREFVFRPEALAGWKGRILILNSRDDSVTFKALEKLQQHYPQATVHLFDEGGHHTFMLYPEAYTAALKDFFSERLLP